MEVTRKNFAEVLETLPEIISKADFLALDTEFTGLQIEGVEGINKLDTQETIYLKNKRRVETFRAIQFGLVAFYQDKHSNCYLYDAFSFYIYPSTLLHEVSFTCQAETLEFLVHHGLDFQKLISEGIPYLREDEVDVLMAKIEKKQMKDLKKEVKISRDLEIPGHFQETLNSIIQKIDQILSENKTEVIHVKKYNSFLRLLIQRELDKYGTTVFACTNKDETMTIKIGLTADEYHVAVLDKYKKEKEIVMNNFGFTKVIKLIVDSRKPIVGHSCSLDLMFTVRQFLHPLPDSYSEFSEIVQFLLPTIFDTKHMLENSDFAEDIDSDLTVSLEYFQKIGVLPLAKATKNHMSFSINGDKLHDAAYDAYLCGIIFIIVCTGKAHLNRNLDIKELLSTPMISKLKNKIYVQRIIDVPCWDLTCKMKDPDRRDTFHIKFPANWQRKDIMNLFDSCRPIKILWLNDESAYVTVQKKENILSKVKNLMRLKSEFTLITFREHHNLIDSASSSSLQ